MFRQNLAVFAAVIVLIFGSATSSRSADTNADAVMHHYTDIALATFQDALSTAKTLEKAIKAFVASPSLDTQNAAKEAWKKARIPYQQSEAFRFGNPLVDAWEAKVNSWPLDEGLIDYVDAGYGTESDENPLYAANIIANKLIKLGGSIIDATNLSPEFLTNTLHSAIGIDTNVATGYHAIEFLLWGQDLNGSEPGNGSRPHTDYDHKNCSNDNCQRRAEYLISVSKLLVSDLEYMVGIWEKSGKARQAFLDRGTAEGLSAILSGLGSLSYGELAGERLKLGLLLHDPEEEHDCFSDNTHNSHYYDSLGIRNVYLGEYTRVDGSVLSGPSVSALVAGKNAILDKAMRTRLNSTVGKMLVMVKRAETTEAYDQMIGEGNSVGNAIVQAAIDALIEQTQTIERVISFLDLAKVKLEGSDSLDNPKAVFE